jgi:hypothetical protein
MRHNGERLFGRTTESRSALKRTTAISLLQSQDDTLHSRKLRSFDEPPFR